MASTPVLHDVDHSGRRIIDADSLAKYKHHRSNLRFGNYSTTANSKAENQPEHEDFQRVPDVQYSCIIPGTVYRIVDDDDPCPWPLENREKYVENPIFRERRIDFKKGLNIQKPNPLDAVFFETAKLLDDYNVQSFVHNYDPLLIEALSIAPTLGYEWHCETMPVVHLLARHKTFVKVQLKLVRDRDLGWQKPTVMLRDNLRWVLLSDWLRGTLGPPRMNLNGKQGYGLQWNWWKTMKKPFRFLDLAAELQELILLFGLGERVAPRLVRKELADGTETSYVAITEGGDAEHFGVEDIDCTAPLVPKTNKSLLVLNKHIHRIAVGVLHNMTKKVYPAAKHLIRHIPQHFVHLRRIELAFTHQEYIDFFGVQVAPFTNYVYPRPRHVSAPATFLRTLPALEYLELNFRSPIDGRGKHPWPGYDENGQPLQTPCQATMVDWIMCFAAEHVEHIPRVYLSGYVKTETLLKWEQGILNARVRPIGWRQWVQDRKEEIANLPEVCMPPPCFCPTNCQYEPLAKLERECRDSGMTRAKQRIVYKKTYEAYRFDFGDVGKRGLIFEKVYGTIKYDDEWGKFEVETFIGEKEGREAEEHEGRIYR